MRGRDQKLRLFNNTAAMFTSLSERFAVAGRGEGHGEAGQRPAVVPVT